MPKKHIVQDGDCLASIAYANGFAIDTVWNDSANATLKEMRSTPFQLVPGDEVTIPDLVPKLVPCETAKRHVFRRKNVPEIMKIQLQDKLKQPRANLSYVLMLDGVRIEGTTDAEGKLQQSISPAIRSAQLIISETEVYELATGYLLPVTEPGGVAARLAALGFLTSEEDGDDAILLADAMKSFQSAEQLTVSGLADDATRAKLVERYGS
jgi:hypothetical protein